MAAKRIEIMDIRQLLELKVRGISNRKIARLTGLHRNSVNCYVQQIEACEKSLKTLLGLSDAELGVLFASNGTIQKDRYEALSGHFEYFGSELKKPGCTKQVLWADYLIKTPDGYSYTQFCEHLSRWLKQINGSGKLIHKAGEKLYVDYTGKKLHYVNKDSGELIEVEIFVGILPCTGYTFVEASASQQLPHFIGSMNKCLRFLGGVTQAIVPDNLKSAVTKGSKYEATLNKTFKDFALHYGTVINPARTYSPQDKALVEGAVHLVYQRIFYPINKMTFFSLAALNIEISRLLVAYNDRLLSLIKLSRKQQFLSIEQSYLSPLPSEEYELKTYRKATVQKMGYVFLSADKNYYSVPYRFISKKVEVSYDYKNVIVTYNNERIASHPRNYQGGAYITISDHLSSAHQFYQNWSPDYFAGLARPHGEQVAAYVKALIESKPYPEVAYKQCLGIFSLSKKFDKTRLNNACTRGLKLSRYGYHIIKNILSNKMDMADQQPSPEEVQNIEAHSNIRGGDYYQ
ncbi:MAG: transposase [Saprospiraceae bacterium]|jgi:transposase